jgi:hypothetical protein
MKTNNIDVVNNISPEEFRSKYLKPQVPLIIKGLADKYPAGKKWSIDLRGCYG